MVNEIEMYRINYGKTVKHTRKVGDNYDSEEYHWTESRAFSHLPDAHEIQQARGELVLAVNTELCKQINGGEIPQAKPVIPSHIKEQIDKVGEPTVSPQVRAEVKAVMDGKSSTDFLPCPECGGKMRQGYKVCWKCNQKNK